MKFFYCIPLLYSLVSAAAIDPAAADASYACPANLQAKLSRCATPSPFCSTLLHQTAGGNYTLTIYTTLKQTSTDDVTRTKGTVYSTTTSYLYSTITTSTSTTSVSTQTVTFPSATGSPTCFVQTVAPSTTSSGMAAAVAAAQTSCGFGAGASDKASSACSCFIDKKTTVTLTTVKTVTSHGTPTVIVTHFQTSTSTSVVVTTTASTTRTVTLTACATPVQSCGNSGLQWAYATALGGNDYPSNSLNFDPTGYKTAPYLINGTTQLVYVPTTGGSGTGLFYGKGPESESSFFVNHRGYFVPPQTGNYTISMPYIDDAAFIWVGALAYSGWNNSNYNAYGSWSTGAPTVTIPMTKNMYYPFRVVMGQGGGAGGLQMTITAPDGETVQSSSAMIGSPYFVSFSCNSTTAPKYPAFGMET